uniref:Uncharacterized protein n=1 Tax=Rhizophora mucronata TaxID=61149 RepID=A0A2P2PL10_RHIMU
MFSTIIVVATGVTFDGY